ncbi:Gfo/Idh/MocA family protein [Jannaschia sp. R86511]|uniref:Gfo/Idh/MocA family protein n=1 Tax=Jannaschia sp. R86511 TaxID=3093853 RepID=UPI0036D26351
MDAVRTSPAAHLGATPVTSATGYRAGIVGAGFMGRVHARAVLVSGGQVVGVTTGSADTAAEAAGRLGAQRGYADVAALVDADDIDVIHVCTPNHLHHEVTMAALAAGKHVVCEKPLATTAAAARELVATQTAAGLVGAVPFVYRFHPMVREARQRVREGGLGRITLAHGSYLQDWLSDAADDNWRVDPALGGTSRAFADIGSHWCDLLEFVTGHRILAVSAQAATVNAERGSRAVTTEDVVTLQLRTDGGILGAAVISQVSPGRKNRLLLEVSGAEGTLTFDQEQPEKLWHGRRASSECLVRDPDTGGSDAAPYHRLPAGHAQGYQDCFDAFVADTAAAVAGRAPAGLPTFADGARSVDVVEAVLRSVRTQQWTDVAA